MSLPRRLHRPVLGIGCTLLFLLAGCSSGNTDVGADLGEDGVRDVVQVFAKALADGDGPRACSLMSVPAQRSMIARVKAGDCLTAVTSASKSLPPGAADALRSLEPRNIALNGQRARVDLAASGVTAEQVAGVLPGTTMDLSVQDARWAVDVATGA